MSLMRSFNTPLSSLLRLPQTVCHSSTNMREQYSSTLQWRHNGLDSVSNHQPHHCLLNRLFGRRSKKTSKLRVTGLCAGNSPGTGEFPAQRASNAENVSLWWRHHETYRFVNTHQPYCLPAIISSFSIIKAQRYDLSLPARHKTVTVIVRI